MQINDIDRQAAEWAAKADGGSLSAVEKAALDAWLTADVRHIGAYAKATAVLVHIERMRAIGAHAEYVSPRRPSLASRRQMLTGGAIAAGLALAVVVTDVGWGYLHQKTYVSGLGETRVVALEDGSVATLNTSTKIVVHYTKDRRSIDLVRGEALFDVAKNRARPFVVAVRDMAVEAVGTSFAVRTLADEPVRVVVREGVVELKRPATPVAAPVLVRANGLAIAPQDAPIMVSQLIPDRIAQELAWKSGRIAFEDQSLGDAARAFARYSNTRVVIDDPVVARRTVTGLFVANDPVAFAKAVAASLDLEANVETSEIKLMQKKRSRNQGS